MKKTICILLFLTQTTQSMEFFRELWEAFKEDFKEHQTKRASRKFGTQSPISEVIPSEDDEEEMNKKILEQLEIIQSQHNEILIRNYFKKLQRHRDNRLRKWDVISQAEIAAYQSESSKQSSD